MKLVKKIGMVIIRIRFLLLRPFIHSIDSTLKKDIVRWKTIKRLEGLEMDVLAFLLWSHPEFRNLFIYRNRYRQIFRRWIALVYKPMDALYIETKEIGGGLFIQHGFATMIAAESIGENCWINQQVTIGFNKGERAPIIGNNVMITCGAKVLGDITIGDNVIIGANAVVISDVESNCTVGGVPAKVLSRKQK